MNKKQKNNNPGNLKTRLKDVIAEEIVPEDIPENLAVVIKMRQRLRFPSGSTVEVPTGTIIEDPWPELIEMAREDLAQKIFGIFTIVKDEDKTKKAKDGLDG